MPESPGQCRSVRAQAVRSGWHLPLSGYAGCSRLGRRFDDIGKDVDVHVIGEACPVVTEQVADDFRVLPGGLAQAGGTMPQVVEADGGRPDR